ncbi:MAG: radical SAM protein [Desulfomonilaceae bacterium]
MNFLFINVNHDVGWESSESIPISLGYILATLKAEGHGGVILDDLRDKPLSFKVLDQMILRLNPTLIGFTTYQSTIDRIRFLSRYIKTRHRKIILALGGPQIHSIPSAALEDLDDIDLLVRAEGEVVMAGVARALSSGRSLNDVNGITYRLDARIVDQTGKVEVPDDLDVYPSPYLTKTINLDGKDTAILLSSRGCKSNCFFCITPSLCKGKIRYHSLSRVIDEMKYLSSQGIERFWFADPNFTENRERTLEFVERKQKLGIQTPFWFQTRSDLLDPELMDALKEAGADTVAFGLESASPKVLKNINKRLNLDQLRQNIEHAKEIGLNAELFTIYGLPGETVDDARVTINFVKSLGVPVELNSGSQQMQLYFGSAYEKNPEKYSIKPLGQRKPKYLSVGENFETSDMRSSEIRKVRNLWALSNEGLERDVYYKQRVFEIIDFLLENKADLEDELQFYAFGALVSSAIEEFDLLVQFLEGYISKASSDDSSVEDIIEALNFFRETDEESGPHDRIIFDSRSYMDGVPFTGISGKYWDVLLGHGLLLHDFEKGLTGAKAGAEVNFSFTFPSDYHQVELAEKTVEIHAKIHKVFRPLSTDSMEGIRHLNIRNHYCFDDLDVLRDQNEILYYLTLRDIDPHELLKTPSHFLTLAHRWAKLGKYEKVKELGRLVADKPPALRALADTLSAAGKHQLALDYYVDQSGNVVSGVLKRVRLLLHLGRAQQAINLLETIPESPDLEFQETMLECLKLSGADPGRVPSLERHVLDLRVKNALEKELLSKRGATINSSSIHGFSSDDDEA